MRDIGAKLKSLRLFGMAAAWNEISADDGAAVQSSRWLISELSDLGFTDEAHNVVFVGSPGTGKTHLASALGVSGVTRHGRVRFYATVDLVNALEQEKAAGKAGRIALSLRNVDLVILDELV